MNSPLTHFRVLKGLQAVFFTLLLYTHYTTAQFGRGTSADNTVLVLWKTLEQKHC